MVLGVYDEHSEVVLLQPQQKLSNGLKNRLMAVMQQNISLFPVGILKIQCSVNEVLLIHFVNEQGLENDNAPLLEKCINQLNEYFDGKRKEFELPLGQGGSSFQKNVWAKFSYIFHWEDD